MSSAVAGMIASTLIINIFFYQYTAIPSALAGIIASTVIIYIFKLKGRQLVLMGLVVSVLATVIVFSLLLYCPTTQLAGVTVPYPDG